MKTLSNGSVDLSSVYDQIGKLKSNIDRLHDKIGYLKDDIATVDRESQNRDDDLEKLIQGLEGKVEMLQDHLEKLMEQVTDSFDHFSTQVSDLISETRDSHEDIVNSVNDVRNTSHEGLKKVTTGIAIIDLLKALSDSHHTATKIERALTEIEGRRSQAEATVEEKKSEYDLHFEQIREGFLQQINVIGEHVSTITQDILPLLEELHIDEDLAAQSVNIVESVQTKITAHRSRVLKSEKEKIDFERIARFQELRRSLNSFVNDRSLIRIEKNLSTSEDNDLQPYGIPIIGVHLTDKFARADSQPYQVFCLSAKGTDCYEKPKPNIDYAQLIKTIHSTCGSLNAESSIPLDGERVNEIKDGLSRLVSKGLLKQEHMELIEKHLEQYPLIWME